MTPTEKFDLIVKLENIKNQRNYDEIKAMEQIEMELNNLSPFYYLKESEFYNIFMVELRKDKINTALQLAQASLKNTFEIVPIESVVITRPDKIVEKVINISKDRMKDNETFIVKCNVSGERYIESKKELVKSICNEMEKLKYHTVENIPDWVIHIEVVGENTGISILKPQDGHSPIL